METMPMDAIAVICYFMRIDAIARVRQTCKTLHTGLVHAWHGALFVPNGKWYELKDVALAAKYMTWTGRVLTLPPPILDTMDNIAFWGTLNDGNRLLATFDPKVLTFETDISCADCELGGSDFDDMRLFSSSGVRNWCAWVDTKTEQEYTTQVDEHVTLFSKQCQINMYAMVKLSSDVGVYKLISGAVKPTGVHYQYGYPFLDSTLLQTSNADGRAAMFLWVDADLLLFHIFDKTSPDFTLEWWLERSDACLPRQHEMDMAFGLSAAKAGRGWNSTRRDVSEQVVTQLH